MESDARFEFRTWARNFGLVERRLRLASDCRDISESEECYLVAPGTDHANVKIRDGVLDIKDCIETRDDLERWSPQIKCAFPLTTETLKGDVLPRLGASLPKQSHESYSLDRLLAEIVVPHRDVAIAVAFKRRFLFTVAGCMAELAEVWINGAGLQSVAVESPDPAAVLEARRMLGLDDMENVSYVQAIKRVVGMVPLRTPY
jgi:hypothetical protein